MRTAPESTGPTPAHRRRAAGLGVLLALGLVVASWWAASSLVEQLAAVAAQPRVTVDDAAAPLALLVLALGLAWLAVIVATSCRALLRREAVPPDTPAARTPRAAIRSNAGLAGRIAAMLLAATAFGSLNATAQAADGVPAVVAVSVWAPTGEQAPAAGTQIPVPDFAPSVDRPAATTVCRSAPEPGWTAAGPRLQRPSSTDQAGLLDRCGSPGPSEGVVVHRGDSLWSIVERELGPDATASEVAATWPAWYAVNRDRIGPDPDVLLPGSTLQRPTQEVLR